MTEEHIKRKLTAILSADVAGYSRLTLPLLVVAFSIMTARAPCRDTAARTHYSILCRDRTEAKILGYLLGSLFQIKYWFLDPELDVEPPPAELYALLT